MFFNLIHVSSCTCLSNHPCEPSESSPTVPALADSLLQTIEKVLHPSSHLVPPVSPTGAVGDNGAADVHLIFSVALPRLLRVLPPSHSRAVDLQMKMKRCWENTSGCTDLGNGSLSGDEGTKCKDDEGGAKHTDRCPSRGFDWKPLSWAPLLWGGRLLWGPHDGAAYYVQSANATQKPIRWNHSGVFPTK